MMSIVQTAISKSRAAMTAAAHQTQVLPTKDFKPVIFSSSVIAKLHQTQVVPVIDFKRMIFLPRKRACCLCVVTIININCILHLYVKLTVLWYLFMTELSASICVPSQEIVKVVFTTPADKPNLILAIRVGPSTARRRHTVPYNYQHHKYWADSVR